MEEVAVERVYSSSLTGGHSWTVDNRVVGSASRDGTVKLWRITLVSLESLTLECVYTHSYNDLPATAIHFTSFGSHYLLAIGFEPVCQHAMYAAIWMLTYVLLQGSLQVCLVSWIEEMLHCKCVCQVPSELCHGGAVRRVVWAPCTHSDEARYYVLASVGEDHTTRLLRFAEAKLSE
jgi:hypothetical protein